MEFKKYTAKTIDEAITNASIEFGVTSDHLEYKVVQEPTNGFLGIGSKPAIIEARVKEVKKPEIRKPEEKKKVVKEEKKAQKPVTKKPVENKPEKVRDQKPKVSEEDEVKILTNDIIEQRAAAAAAKTQGSKNAEERDFSERKERGNGRRKYDRDRRRSYDRNDRRKRENPVPRHEPSKPKPERVVTPKSEEEVAEITKKASDFLSGVFEAMNLTVSMETSYDQKEGALEVVFSGDEMGILIGKRGQTLDSLQYLTSLVVNKGQNEYTRIKLDTEDYRVRREETLNNLARNIAFKVRKTHRPVSLEPMNPYERRIIHSALQNNKFVETYSEGEEPYRHVVVAPKR